MSRRRQRPSPVRLRSRRPEQSRGAQADPSLIIKGLVTINEVFYSVQGESTYAGRPCVFVRLTACDLRCSWCDTPYAFNEGRKRAIDDVVAEVERYDCSLVEVTGGEPLLQEDVYPLMDELLARGKTVLLETGGHHSTARVPAPVVTILDIKCPASGEADRMDWENLARLRPRDEVKFVINDRADYEYAREAITRHVLAGRAAAIHMSPVHGVLNPRTLSEWVLADHLPVRVQLQLHKYIWPADLRGV
jgi:7-carboxy-7-deazaguanine synthase